ncbi:HAUS augmin-like complex subunit 3 [Strix aluco]|uniref:HAUS augmin-like complex subunit 3 n=1 Tax=Strix aluco TaxID=111821 RepID=UPI003DA24A6D
MIPTFSLLVLTILAMFSQRCFQAFPLDTVDRGAEFVATLSLVYPHADTLCAKDFDWLYDCPQTKQFLEWFCSTVGEENVLSPAEVEAYDALLASGKPILEGDVLEQALQMCCHVPQLPSMIPNDEGPSLEALQQELQELKDYRDVQLWRHNKLQVWAANLQQELKYLEEGEKVVKQDLRKAQMDLEVDILQTRAVLSQISKAAKHLAEWYGDMGKGRPPALLCEMDLGPYMELEQQATDVFERFAQQVLPGSVQAPDAQGASAQGERSLKERLEAGTQIDSDWEIPEGRRGAPYQECAKTPWGVAPASRGVLVQGSRAELLVEGRNGKKVLSMEDEERDGSQEATERKDTKKTKMPKSLGTDGDELLDDQDGFWKELSRIEKAHICAQREVIVMSAKVEGHCAALEWAQRTLEALKENQYVVKAELQSQAAMRQKQLHTLRCDIMQTLAHQLPPLLKVEARLFHLPILQRQLSLKAAHLRYVAGRQEEAAAWLASQHSRLDLLELQLKREIKEMDQKAAWLGEMETAMREAQTRLQEQKDYFKDASSCKKCCPRTWIDPKDLSAVRLWDMLMGQDQKKQLLRSYKTMVARCSQLVQDQRVLEAQLAAPVPQLPALEASTEMLYRLLYDSSNKLQLSSPEITEMMQQLITMQDNLYQMLTDLLSDLKAKRRSLENPILQTERNLYVYFYCNEDRLREVVEHLEKQVSAFSPPLRELPYAEE